MTACHKQAQKSFNLTVNIFSIVFNLLQATNWVWYSLFVHCMYYATQYTDNVQWWNVELHICLTQGVFTWHRGDFRPGTSSLWFPLVALY